MVAVEAEKVPAPAKGVPLANVKEELAACVQLPVRVSVPVTVVTPPVYPLDVVPLLMVKPLPKVMPPVPAPARLPTSCAAPDPTFIRLAEDCVMPALNKVAGFCPERSKVPPEFMVTAPVKVRKPVAPVVVFKVPVTPVVPVTVKAKLPMERVPAVKVKFWAVVIAAELVHPPPVPLKIT